MLFWGMYSSVYAQNSRRIYKTQSVLNALKTTHPEILDSLRLVERHIYQYRPIGTNETVTIPVVFHVLHHADNPAEQLNKTALEAQLAALNRDFQGASPAQSSFIASAAGFDQLNANNTGIQFCLADNGVNYVPTTQRSWSDDAIKLAAPARNPKQYLNIWIGNLEGFAGYAYLPGMAYDVAMDGVVVDYRYVDGSLSDFALHRTGVHLVAGFLGLKELWNENQPCGDDGVLDTPIHNAPNYGQTNTYKHVSTCFNGEFAVEMTVNLLDAGVDEQLYMFTKGQKKRLRAVLGIGGFRHSLTQTPTNCQGTEIIETPIAAQSRNHSPISTVEIAVIPNPAKDNFQVALSGKAQQAQLSIFDAQGKRLYESGIFSLDGRQDIPIDGSRWLSGIYFLKLQTDIQLLNRTFIINR